MDDKMFFDFASKLEFVKTTFLSTSSKSLGVDCKDMHFLGLIHDKGCLSQNEISKILNVDKAYVSRVLKDLEEKGYVTRVDQDDNRKKVFVITPSGDALGKSAEKIIKKFVAEVLFKDITDEEKSSFRQVFEKMISNANEHFKKGEQNETVD